MTLDTKLLTKVVLENTCDDCWRMPTYQLNRFANWSKEWYSYYACNEHVNDVITNRLCADEFMEILEFDSSGLVQCIDCGSFTPCQTLACQYHGGECDQGLSLYMFAHKHPRTCNKYEIKAAEE